MRCKPPRAHAGVLATLDQRPGRSLRALVWLLVKCGACFCSLSGVFRKQLGFMFRGGWGVLARGCGRLCGCAGRFGGSQCLPPTCPNIVSGESDGLENLEAKALFLPVWMTLRGPHTLVLPVPLPKQRCCQKPLLGEASAGGRTGLSWNYSRRAWKKLHSSQSCDCGLGWQMLRLIVGACGVMGSWTYPLVTLEVVWLAGSASSATMPSAM